MADKKFSGEEIGSLIFVLIAGSVWLAGFPAFVREQVAQSDEPTAGSPVRITRLQGAVASELAPSSPVEVRSKGGDDADVFLTRKDLESVPFPDREMLLARIGAAWCPKNSSALSRWAANSKVRFRDIKSGATFGEFGCRSTKATVPAPE
ncbi:MAG TPA: hypothetical protein VGM13_06505 [Thermoanaerobaculia bacterium]|jgi:hypothetical protein